MEIRNYLKESYDAHQFGYERQESPVDETHHLQTLHVLHSKTKERIYQNKRRYDKIRPLISKEDKWLDIGDHYGEESAWLSLYCKDALSADINDTLLKVACKYGYINAYMQQNVENMTFEDSSFDFVLCRESYHHFPRPYIGVYEMLRCAKKGVVISEPLDPLLKMPFLLWLCNIIDTKKNPLRSWKFWKNSFSFEVVGNYVYKISQREFEKIAMGIGLPAVAFHYANDTCVNLSKESKKIERKIINILCKLRILPYQGMTAVLFKELPNTETKNKLRQAGYYYYELPQNPYLKDT